MLFCNYIYICLYIWIQNVLPHFRPLDVSCSHLQTLQFTSRLINILLVRRLKMIEDVCWDDEKCTYIFFHGHASAFTSKHLMQLLFSFHFGLCKFTFVLSTSHWKAQAIFWMETVVGAMSTLYEAWATNRAASGNVTWIELTCNWLQWYRKDNITAHVAKQETGLKQSDPVCIYISSPAPCHVPSSQSDCLTLGVVCECVAASLLCSSLQTSALPLSKFKWPHCLMAVWLRCFPTPE